MELPLTLLDQVELFQDAWDRSEKAVEGPSADDEHDATVEALEIGAATIEKLVRFISEQ